MKRDKKFIRQLKREVKKDGNKRRRAYYKNDLAKCPEEAHLCEIYDFKELNSKQFNGIDTKSKSEVDYVR